MNPLRIWNVAQLFFSFGASRLFQRALHVGSPMSISIEPTTSCNLRCPECPSGLRAFTRPTGMLDPVFFKKILDQISPRLTLINFYFQGEPFLNRHLTSLIKMAADKKIYTSTSTNAHYLDDETARKTVESGLSRLIISIDGTTQESYQQYRIGGNLDKVIQGTKRIIEWKKKLNSSTPHVIFQFLVVKPNEHQTNDVLKLAEELNVDEVKFKTAQVYDFENGNPLIPENNKYSRYRLKPDGKWELKNKMENHCWRMWQGCVITWDGSLLPCCFDKDAQNRIGNLSDNNFNSIWKGTEYNKFRNAVLTNRQEIDICKNCTEGTEVFV